MGEFGITHWLVIGVILIVLFGPKRLPALGQSLGESIRGFKKAMNDHHDTPPQDQAQPQRRETLQATDVDVTPHATSTSTKDTTHS